MAKSKQKKEVVVPVDFNAVIYTDGGCVPNPGFGGFGVHAYTWRETGVNINRYRYGKRTTTTGYGTDSAPLEDRVAAIDVFSASGVVEPGKATSNNVAELQGLLVALEAMLAYKPADGNGSLKSIFLNLDSQYVLKILEVVSKKGKTRDERIAIINKPMSDGKPRKNKAYIFRLLDMVEKYEKAGIKIGHKWVKGHDGNVGNEEADVLATRGVRLNTQMHSRSASLYAGKHNSHERWTDVKTFWRSKEEPSPLIDHTNVVFTNEMPSVLGHLIIEHKGEDYFPYLCSTEADELRAEKKSPPGANGFADDEDSDDDSTEENQEGLDGTESKKDAESKYPKVAGRLAHYKAGTTRALVLLKEKLTAVEDIFSLYRSSPLYERVLNDIVLLKMPVLNSAAFQADYALMGTEALEMQDNYLNHTIYPLSRASLSYGPELAALHVHPQKVSLYMLENFQEMGVWLGQYLRGDYNNFGGVEDITNLFYGEDPVTGKTTLLPTHKNGMTRVEYTHTTTAQDELGANESMEVKLAMVAGLHFPSRNKLKRLEAFNPKVTLLSKLVAYAEKTFATFRFFIVIEADCGIAIYVAEASNLVIKDLSEKP